MKYKCPICKETFDSPKLKYHYFWNQDDREEEEYWCCPHCGYDGITFGNYDYEDKSQRI